MYRFVSTLPRAAKRRILLAVDVAMVPLALLAAFALQSNGLPPADSFVRQWQALPLLMTIAALLLMVLGIANMFGVDGAAAAAAGALVN